MKREQGRCQISDPSSVGLPYTALFNPNSVGHYPNTALFNPQKHFFLTCPCQGSDLSSLGRLILKKQGLMVVVNDGVCPPPKVANFPEGLLCPMPRRPLMVRAALL